MAGQGFPMIVPLNKAFELRFVLNRIKVKVFNLKVI